MKSSAIPSFSRLKQTFALVTFFSLANPIAPGSAAPGLYEPSNQNTLLTQVDAQKADPEPYPNLRSRLYKDAVKQSMLRNPRIVKAFSDAVEQSEFGINTGRVIDVRRKITPMLSGIGLSVSLPSAPFMTFGITGGAYAEGIGLVDEYYESTIRDWIIDNPKELDDLIDVIEKHAYDKDRDPNSILSKALEYAKRSDPNYPRELGVQGLKDTHPDLAGAYERTGLNDERLERLAAGEKLKKKELQKIAKELITEYLEEEKKGG